MQATLGDFLLAVAGLGCLAAAVVHSVLGERRFVRPIQAQMTWPGNERAGDFARLVVRLAWHVTSVMWTGFAALLLAPLFGFHGLTPVYVVAAATFGVALIMTGPMTAWRHLGWPVFALVTVSLVGAVLLSA
jgi:hypothetical protein